MHQQDIQAYIKQHAKSTSIQRSYYYKPVLQSQKDGEFAYLCQGTLGDKYAVNISVGKTLTTYCSCPYDHGGICKHTVASLRALTKQYPEIDNRMSKVTPPKKTDLKYSLNNNNEIDIDEVIDDFRNKGIYLDHYWAPECWLEEFKSGNRIHVKTRLHQSTAYTTTFLRQDNAVKISCTCHAHMKKRYCAHVLAASVFLFDNLGNDCLGEGFLNNKIATYLAQYGLTPADDYHPYFTFELSEQGFVVNKIQDNLTPLNALPTYDIPNILPQTLIEQQQRKMGIGLIFEYDGRQFSHFTNVKANYDKAGQELSTRFEQIEDYQLSELNTKRNERDVFYLTNHINSLYCRHSNKAFFQAINLFDELSEHLTDFPIFVHRKNKTYTRKNMDVLSIDNETPVQLFFQLKSDEHYYHLTAKIRLGEVAIQVNSSKLYINLLFVRHDNVIHPLRNAQLAADIVYYEEKPKLTFLKLDHTAFYENIIAPLSKHYEIQGNAIKDAKPSKQPKPKKNKNNENSESIEHKKLHTATPEALNEDIERQIYVNETEDGVVIFRLALQYPDKLIDIHSQEMRLSIDEKGNFTNEPRDEILEKTFIEEFESLHDNFNNAPTYAVTPAQLIENFWFLEAASKLRDNGVKLLGLKDLKSFNYNLNKPSASLSVQSDIDWFDVQLDIAFGDQSVNLKALQKAFVKKQNYIELGDGTIGMLPEKWLAQFEQYFKVGEVKKGHIRISNYQFGVIDALYEELDEKPEFLIDLYERKQRLKDLHLQDDVKKPRGVKADLRPYQQEGLNWLSFLHENRLGGCLADDMGLGKTLQTITFLQHLKITQKPKKPSIIIAPTSLIFNWLNEIENFCPTLKALNFTGGNRAEKLNEFDKYDVILTTYGSLLKDIETLKDREFNYAILDESQTIKNPQSQRYKAVRLLNSYNRVILTGTPIENNTFDLYAQFSFINPGLLGSISHFRSEFSEAIDKNKDVGASELLAKLVNPFILRRTKEQVATELPPKIESVMYCDMGTKQRKVYEAIKVDYRNSLIGVIEENGIEKSQMHILDGLMKLRQICNSPAILGGEVDYGDESVKLEMLTENILEKTGKHKILVFSSFVKMLKLIQTRLNKENITCEYLDGKTRNRQEKVENFQNNANIRVFLISTKAGGMGLNLTEADYVFIVDPWWNPAVENQAIDRSYRIGQNKHVMAYRMICKDSIEEKILDLQVKKKKVADSIISVDEEKKSFDLNEVKQLFD